jgi:alkylation response protein AidB-like acyl-CoA dehydrogenase
MDFALSPDQTLMKQSVDRFVEENYAPDRRASRPRLETGFNREHWTSFAELGWLGLPIPEANGGFGGTPIDTMILMEAFGAGLVSEPFVPTVVVAGSILAASSGTFAAGLLTDLIEGTKIATLAYAEPQAGYEPARVSTTARRDGDSLVVDGRKVAVPYAVASDYVIVSVRTAGEAGSADGISLVAIPSDAPGVTRRDYDTYDERRASDITFDQVRVPLTAVIGKLDGGLPVLDHALDLGNVALCAEAVGAMAALHRGTVDYIKTRTQFGRPIGSFQALQHRAVDMLVQLELARAITTCAASIVGGDDAAASRRASAAAKVQICDSSRFVGEQAIQLHGAIGLTEELFIGHYVKRLTVLARELGDAAYAVKRYVAAGTST